MIKIGFSYVNFMHKSLQAFQVYFRIHSLYAYQFFVYFKITNKSKIWKKVIQNSVLSKSKHKPWPYRFKLGIVFSIYTCLV